MNEPCGMPQAALAGLGIIAGALAAINIAKIGSALYMAYAENRPVRSRQ